MTSDDVTAWAAISFGAALSVSATALLLQASPRPGPLPTPPSNLRVEVVRISPPPGPVVDFAIIRSGGETEIMVGPEGPATGWLPQKGLEMRKAPPR